MNNKQQISSPDYNTTMDKKLDVTTTTIPLLVRFIIFTVFIISFRYFINYLILFFLLNSLKN